MGLLGQLLGCGEARVGAEDAADETNAGRDANGGASKAPNRKQVEQVINDAVSAAKAVDKESKKEKRHASQATNQDVKSWSVELWAASIEKITTHIADSLLKPLQKGGKSAWSSPINLSEATELAYVRSIGSETADVGREALLKLLRDSDLLDKLADELFSNAKELCEARAATQQELQDKFLEHGGFNLSYGGMETFYGGLEGLLGPPSTQLLEAMTREHCDSQDSERAFDSPNYLVHTTSRIEWHFVYDPIVSTDPETGNLLESSCGRMDGQLVDTWPVETREGCEPRTPEPMGSYEAKWADIDEQLEALDFDTLKDVEFWGARMYTGPCYIKYNAVLRGQQAKAMYERWYDLCRGNRYATTIHVINSAVVKLGKLQPAAKVYRGVAGGILPDAFWKPNQHNVRGGCEYGFLSTTLDDTVATEYASSSGRAGVIFEIQMGMVDRGASLQWLSQYPHEAEILFAPLTGLEVQDVRGENGVLVVEVRLSVNLNNPTIEEVTSKMQSSALELLELMIDDFAHHGAPERALEPLRTYEALTECQDPDWFFVSKNYESCVGHALAAKHEVIKLLGIEETWESSFDDWVHTQRLERLTSSGSSPGETTELPGGGVLADVSSAIETAAEAVGNTVGHAAEAVGNTVGHAAEAVGSLADGAAAVFSAAAPSEMGTSRPSLSERSLVSTGGGRYGSVLGGMGPRDDLEANARAKQVTSQQLCAGLAAREKVHDVAAELLRLVVRTSMSDDDFRSGVVSKVRKTLLKQEWAERLKQVVARGSTCFSPLTRLLAEVQGQPTETSREESMTACLGDDEWRIYACQLLINEGCIPPWPATFVTIALGASPERRHAVLCACAVLAKAQMRPANRKKGASCIVHDKKRQQWIGGKIVAVHRPDDGRPNEPQGAAQRRAAPEKQFDVKAGIHVYKGLPPSRVLTPSIGGIGAILREAAGASGVDVGLPVCGEDAEVLVEALLALGVSVFNVDYSGTTALHCAAETGSVKVCKWLMELGAEPELDNCRQASPEEYALYRQNIPARQLFHPEMSADPFGERGWVDEARLASSPLLAALVHESTEDGALAAISALLDHEGLPPDERNDAGLMLHGPSLGLMVAAWKGFTSCVTRLLQASADHNAQAAPLGACALLLASEQGHEECVRRLIAWGEADGHKDLELGLLQSASPDGAPGFTALEQASRYGRAAVVECLLRAGARDSEHGGADGELAGRRPTALFLAASAGYEKCVALLLSAQYAPTSGLQEYLDTAHEGSTAQHRREPEASAVDVDALEGSTALFAASLFGHDATVDLLLDHKASLEIPNAHGDTALLVACANGNDAVVMALLQAGADLAVQGQYGFSCLMVACRFSHVHTIRTLSAFGATTKSSQPAAERGSGAKSIVGLVDDEGQTALHHACFYEQEFDSDVLKMLLTQLDANVEATTPLTPTERGGPREEDLSTPLHIAAANQHDVAASALVNHGASRSAKRRDGHTPLTLAAMNGHESICSILLQPQTKASGAGGGARADDDATSLLLYSGAPGGSSALHLAAEHAHADVVKLLLDVVKPDEKKDDATRKKDEATKKQMLKTKDAKGKTARDLATDKAVRALFEKEVASPVKGQRRRSLMQRKSLRKEGLTLAGA